MVTNIASRLCGLGELGAISLGSTTAKLVERRFTLRGPVSTRLKNVRDPEPVYKLQRGHDNH